MRFILGLIVGIAGGLGVFYMSWDPETVFPFSEKWSTWEVSQDDSPTPLKLRTRLTYYPLVSCRIVPTMTGIGLTTVRVGVRIEGFEYLPFLTKDGLARLSYNCLWDFREHYTSESLNALRQRTL